MSIDYTSSNLFDEGGLNITSLYSSDAFTTQNNYSLNLAGSSSLNLGINQLQTHRNNSEIGNYTAANSKYSNISGYGLINAADAVSKATNQNNFSDVSNLGGNNWGSDLVKAPEVWAKGYTGKNVVVAVLDTGVDYNHEDLKDNIWTNSKEIAGNGVDDDGDGYIDDVHGWNFVDNNNEVMDRYGHGTHVSGTIAGENNKIGVTGIAYDAKIMPVKVLGDDGSGSYNGIANGIRYAANNGANVINLSLGGDYPNSTLQSAIEYASKKGVIVVMAAGNSGDVAPGYPARYADKYGIAVGAVDKNNNMPDFSNRSGTNQLTYVTAPGVEIYSTVPGDKYATYSGTSMATPHVAGVVALMLSANPNLNDAQVRQILADTAGNSTKSAVSSFDTSSFSSSFRSNSLDYPPSRAYSDISFDRFDNYEQSKPKNFSFNSRIQNNTQLWPQFQDKLGDNMGDNLENAQDIIGDRQKQMLQYQEWVQDINLQTV